MIRKLDMLLCIAAKWWRREASLCLDVLLMLNQQNSVWKEWHFCNPIYLPIYLPSIFCFFMEGALGLANPHVPFLLIFYLELSLLLPRPQIKQLGTFFLYLTILSAKIELFGQISFSNLQQKLKYDMIQIRLLDHPSKFSQPQAMYTHCILLEIWDLCITKAEHIWNFLCQSWNMKPIDIGI